MPDRLGFFDTVLGIITASIGAFVSFYKLVVWGHKYYKSKTERNKKLSLFVDSYMEEREKAHQDAKEKMRLIELAIETATKNSETLQKVLQELTKQSVTQKIIIDEQGAYWFTDSTGGTVEMGKKAQEVTGRPDKENMGFNWFNHVHPDDKQLVQRDMEFAQENKTDFLTKYRYNNPHKGYIYIVAYARIVMDGGSVIGWVGSVKELTELDYANH